MQDKSPPEEAPIDGAAPSGQSQSSEPKKRFVFIPRIRMSAVLAITLAVGATAWIVSGNPQFQQQLGLGPQVLATRAPPIDESQETPKAQDAARGVELVRVLESTALRQVNTYKVTGQTDISRAVIVRAQTAAPVAELHISDGMIVKKGDLLSKLADEARLIDIEQASAEVSLREIEYDAAEKLTSRGYQSTIKKTESNMHLVQARSGLARAKIEAARVNITAPFDGVVDKTYVEPGSFVSRGDEIVRLLDLDPILIVAQIPETIVGNIEHGQDVSVQLSTKQRLKGKVSYIAMSGLDKTRTFRIEVEVPNPRNEIRARITAALEIPMQTVATHTVPLSAIGLNAAGEFGIKAVNDDNQVIFYLAEVISDDGTFLKLGGLPEQLRIIVAGQEFVSIGETVQVAIANEL